MAEEQRSLQGYKSKRAEPGEGFENPNIGKPVLNDQDEYVLKLVKFPHVVTVEQPKEKKDGTKYVEKVDKAVCEFEERVTKNIVTAFFRVDRLNFGDDEAYRSAVVKFFAKIGHPLPEEGDFAWEDYFVPGMRFRSRVVVGMDMKDVNGRKVKTPNFKYYLDIPTCRKLLPTDTEGEDFAKPAEPAAEKPKPNEGAALLANAMFIVKGSKDRKEALDKLAEAKADKSVVMAFFNADLEEKVKYPI